MKKYEVLVDVVESHVLTIEARDEYEAEDLAESDGCDNEPHHTAVKVVSIKEVNESEIIVSNDCCDYKLEDGDGILLYNDYKGTGHDEWGEVQLFEHFSKGDIAYLEKQFGCKVWVGCGQFGDCSEELIQTDELVEFKEVNDEE